MFDLHDDRFAHLAPLCFVAGTLLALSTLFSGTSGLLFDVTGEDLDALRGGWPSTTSPR